MIWEWGSAVLVASLLGSGHCVGMCGPFALLAAGNAQEATTGLSQRWTKLTAYHFGRLTTYLALGALMGGIGSVTDGLAMSAGWTPIAARIVGGMMVVMGILYGIRWFRGGHAAVSHSAWAQRWNQNLIRIRKRWTVRTPMGAAYSWGVISTWLPCGWLYVFAIAAASAGGVALGMFLMSAFWVGTLPLLSLVPVGSWLVTGSARWSATSSTGAMSNTGAHAAQAVAPGFARSILSTFAAACASVQPFVQPATACLLIGFGIFTATSRADVLLKDLRIPKTEQALGVGVQEQLHEVIDQALPCCENCARPSDEDGE